MNIQFIILINAWRFMEPEYHRVNISIHLNIPINSGWLMFEICNNSGIQMGSMSSCDWNNLKPFTLIEGEAPAAGIAQWFVARPLIGTMCEVLRWNQCYFTNFYIRCSKLTLIPDGAMGRLMVLFAFKRGIWCPAKNWFVWAMGIQPTRGILPSIDKCGWDLCP